MDPVATPQLLPGHAVFVVKQAGFFYLLNRHRPTSKLLATSGPASRRVLAVLVGTPPREVVDMVVLRVVVEVPAVAVGRWTRTDEGLEDHVVQSTEHGPPLTSQSAKHAKMALDAGVEERRIRLAEQIGAQFAMALEGIRKGLDLSPAQQAVWKQLVTTNMLAIDAQLAS